MSEIEPRKWTNPDSGNTFIMWPNGETTGPYVNQDDADQEIAGNTEGKSMSWRPAARSAKRLGKPYRHPTVPGTYQAYIVTMTDGSERNVSVPTAYGRQMAAVAKLNAESQSTS
jgi:hypothetical protein